MRFQAFLVLLLAFSAIGTIAARKQRPKPHGSNTHGSTGSKGSTPVQREPTSSGTSPSKTSSGDRTEHQQSTNSNTDLLNAERGGATQPAGKPDSTSGTGTESKQGTSRYEPSAPTETHTDQGSNTQHGPWSNPHIDTNQQKPSNQTHPPGSNTPGGTNQPSATVNGGGDTIHHHHHHHHEHAMQCNQTNQSKSPPGPCIVNNSFCNISDNDIFNITEELFAMSPDISKYIQLDLQKRSTSSNATDEAKNPLFRIDPILLNDPSIYITHTLYDKHGPDFRDWVNPTQETREHENLLIDTYLGTTVMARAMKWLSDRQFIGRDDFERKDVLRRIWFTIHGGTTCGFEQIFESEKYSQDFAGVRDWLYFAKKESSGRIDYMSYVDQLKLGTTASLLKLNFALDGIVKQNQTIFVGTMPELEMALYTICAYARSNGVCSVSLGGTRFAIYTHSSMYSPGNIVLYGGFPFFETRNTL